MSVYNRDSAKAGLRGLFNISVTPFDADGALDQAALAEHLERIMAAGYDGVLIGGTYGEFATMDPAERATLFGAAAGIVGSRIPMLLCTAGSDVRVVEELTRLAASLGGVPMVMPPYVSEVTDDQIVAFFRRICRAAPAVVIYNAPGVGITLPPALIERLSEIEGIVGLKQGELAPATVDALVGRLAGRIRLFCASDLQMPGPLAAGFDGLSSTNSCALPELIHASFHAFWGGDARQGAALYRSWYDYRTFARAAGQPQTVKAAMDLRGWRGGHVRAPLLDLDETQRAALEPIMASIVPNQPARDVHDRAYSGPAPATTEPTLHPAELTA
jgi:dihydrodipicolinate synthase/N-acetylneuraminate lyase